ncbi:MAG: alkylphosphonate utilization protein [Bdellovibrionales bacterium]|nr:alkylphosphonate utilization protein [Bdellovibrionales bacterium]
METAPKCPECSAEFTYADGSLWVCPSCAHEWSMHAPTPLASDEEESPSGEPSVRDAHGNPLASGDSVTVIKDLKVKGASSVVKAGTKVRNIRIVDSSDGHNIACKIDGIGAMNLKSEFVKKA